MLTRTRLGMRAGSRPAIPVTSMTSRAPASRASTDSMYPLSCPIRMRSRIGVAIAAVRQVAAAKPAKTAARARHRCSAARRRRSRFAPSPTGFLHIGGGRTALFNWLYAKKTGGKMLLRIEDTDRERSTDAAIDAIIDGLKWLGIEWDGDTVFQFARAGRHREVAEQLLAEGKAYYCYATPRSCRQMRETARAEGKSKLYNGLWRDRDPSDPRPDVKPTIRLKAPLTGETVIEDQVQGRVVWQNENLDDLVLLRGDGNPTYMLAVVVDDHDMGVTHVIRGDDHLINAARQKQIYDALGWTVPSMSHIPLIHGPMVRNSRSATARSASRPIARWAMCRPPCGITWCGSAGAMAIRKSSRPRR
jgi:glutamyl/glutaminyl-tRNA synthetase